MTELTEGRIKFVESKMYWPSLIGLWSARIIMLLCTAYGREDAMRILALIFN